MAWVETTSLSFAARHESDQTEAAERVLYELEAFRNSLADLFDRTPGDVAVIIHPRPVMLALAHPWLPLARLAAAPASRRYFAGWFASNEIHALARPALERRSSGVEGSAEALLLTPQHEYSHLVIGQENPDLPPPFTPSHVPPLPAARLALRGSGHLAQRPDRPPARRRSCAG